MKKFLVLNQAFQVLNPYAVGIKKQEIIPNPQTPQTMMARPLTPEDNLMDEPEAKALIEHMAVAQLQQKFHLVEIKSTAKAKPPIVWEGSTSA